MLSPERLRLSAWPGVVVVAPELAGGREGDLLDVEGGVVDEAVLFGAGIGEGLGVDQGP